MIRDTSIEVYHQILAEGLITKREQEVYDALFRFGPLTGKEIVKVARMSGSTGQSDSLVPRLAQMREKEVVREVGERKCSVTGRNAILWDVTSKLPKKAQQGCAVKMKVLKPTFNVVEVTDRLELMYQSDHSSWIRELREWLRDNFVIGGKKCRSEE